MARQLYKSIPAELSPRMQPQTWLTLVVLMGCAMSGISEHAPLSMKQHGLKGFRWLLDHTSVVTTKDSATQGVRPRSPAPPAPPTRPPRPLHKPPTRKPLPRRLPPPSPSPRRAPPPPKLVSPPLPSPTPQPAPYLPTLPPNPTNSPPVPSPNPTPQPASPPPSPSPSPSPSRQRPMPPAPRRSPPPKHMRPNEPDAPDSPTASLAKPPRYPLLPTEPPRAPKPPPNPKPPPPKPVPSPSPKAVFMAPVGAIADQGNGLDAQAVLDRHNYWRAQHGADPLVWDATLAQRAQDWADNCYYEHSGYSYGENLAIGPPVKMVDAFYSEICEYDYSNPKWSEATGHFSQLVWTQTKLLGCAVGYCPYGVQDAAGTKWKNQPMLVCEYWPPGNMKGMYRQFVPPRLPNEPAVCGQ